MMECSNDIEAARLLKVISEAVGEYIELAESDPMLFPDPLWESGARHQVQRLHEHFERH